jgi:hypothetical protein
MNRIFAAGGALALLTAPAAAHHSFAMFDQTKIVTLEGTVAEFQWTNPHAFIELEAAGGRHWSIELNSPNNLKRQGWSSTSLKSGDQVTLVTYPLRDQSAHKGGLFIEVTRADGTVLKEAAFAGARGPVNVPTLPPAQP